MNPASLRRLLSSALLSVLPACGGGNPAAPPAASVPPPTTTLLPTTLAELSASVTSPESGRQLECREDVHARVTLTNRGQSGVSVTGIHKTSRALTGGCVGAPEFTYSIRSRIVPANTTTVVFDASLYSNGSGCCEDPKRCGGSCGFQESFDVVTAIGSVPAGSFKFNLGFSSRCPACGTAAASTAGCPPGMRAASQTETAGDS